MHITRITRHPRESGDPVVALDDEQALHITRITRHPRESGDPVVALDDEQALHIMRITRHPRESGDPFVALQMGKRPASDARQCWIPACAGMTGWRLHGNDSYAGCGARAISRSSIGRWMMPATMPSAIDRYQTRS